MLRVIYSAHKIYNGLLRVFLFFEVTLENSVQLFTYGNEERLTKVINY